MTAQESPLPYSVMGSSGHNGNHIPENILMDDPKNSVSTTTRGLTALASWLPFIELSVDHKRLPVSTHRTMDHAAA
jgi:hypothetical protein